MFKTKTTLASAAFAAAALAACTTNYGGESLTLDASAASGAETFVFLTDGAFIQSDPRFPQFPASAADALIRSAIEAELTGRGLDRAADGEIADLVIAYAVSAEPEVETYADVYVGRFGRVQDIDVTETEHVEGALVVDVFDGSTGAPVWRGWAQGEIRPSSRGNLEAAVTGAIEEIFSAFPALSAAQS